MSRKKRFEAAQNKLDTPPHVLNDNDWSVLLTPGPLGVDWSWTTQFAVIVGCIIVIGLMAVFGGCK